VDEHQLPKPASGAFACVYQMKCSNGCWAVRCFLRQYADQERAARYLAISEHLDAVKLPWMVGFKYLSKGILVHGQWYPILRMEWIEGEPLDAYIRSHLQQREILLSLVRQWIDLMSSLRKARIAHGDLQHGNILVSGGVPRLIDYDAMFVPALSGKASDEDGHRNYQHPDRTGRDYNPDLDNFSAWVIFTSISGLAIDPRLWDPLKAGDECLLFRREDFERPMSSKALQALEGSGNLRLQALSYHFRSLLSLPLNQIPSLDGSALPDWLRDHVGDGNQPATRSSLDIGVNPTPIGEADRLFDLLLEEKPRVSLRHLEVDPRDSIALRSLLGFMALLAADWSIGWLPVRLITLITILVLPAYGIVLSARYRVTRPTEEKRLVENRLKKSGALVSQTEEAVQRLFWERENLTKPTALIKKAREELPQKHREEQDRLNRNLQSTLQRLEARRRQLKKEEEDELRSVSNQKCSALTQLSRREDACDREEQAEIEITLERIRDKYVLDSLESQKLKSWIGFGFYCRLRIAGIRSLRDVSDRRLRYVARIDEEAKVKILLDWRRKIEQLAEAHAPSSLPDSELSRIRRRYLPERDSIDQQIGLVKEKEQRDSQRIRHQFAVSRSKVKEEEASARRNYNLQVDALPAKYDGERSRLTDEYAAEMKRAAEAQKKLDEELNRKNLSLVLRKLEAREVEHELEQYRKVNYPRYIIALLF